MKKALAILLPFVALIFVLANIERVDNDLEPEPPKATEWHRRAMQSVTEQHKDNIEAFLQTLDNREEFEQWMAKDASKMTKEEKREHWRQMRQLLTDEQFQQWRDIHQETRNTRKDLQQHNRQRYIEMVGGEKEWEKHREDMKKVREQRQQNLEAQKQQSQQEKEEE